MECSNKYKLEIYLDYSLGGWQYVPGNRLINGAKIFENHFTSKKKLSLRTVS